MGEKFTEQQAAEHEEVKLMSKWTVTWEETVSYRVTVDADTPEDAIRAAKEGDHSGACPKSTYAEWNDDSFRALQEVAA